MNNLGALIEALEGLAVDHGADAQIRIAVMGYRSNMEYHVEDVVGARLGGDGGPAVVYFVQSSGNEYVSADARKAILDED